MANEEQQKSAKAEVATLPWEIAYRQFANEFEPFEWKGKQSRCPC